MDILERAPILLCQAPFGAGTPHCQITPQIKYDALPAYIAKAIDELLEGKSVL